MTVQTLPSHKRDSTSPSSLTTPTPTTTPHHSSWSFCGGAGGIGSGDTGERDGTTTTSRLKNVTSIISYRRRFEKELPTTIDLSRTSAEHEGLGIYTSLDSDRSYEPLSPRLYVRTNSAAGGGGGGGGGGSGFGFGGGSAGGFGGRERGGKRSSIISRRRTDPIYGTLRRRQSTSPTTARASTAATTTPTTMSTTNMLTRTKSGTYVHPMRQTPRAHDNFVWGARNHNKQQDSDDDDGGGCGCGGGGLGGGHFYTDDFDLFPTCFQDHHDEQRGAKAPSATIGQTQSSPHAAGTAKATTTTAATAKGTTAPAAPSSSPAKVDANLVPSGPLSDSCGYTSSTTTASQSPENEHLGNLPGFPPPPSAAASTTTATTTPSYTIYTRGENNNSSSIVTSIVDVRTAPATANSSSRMATGRTSLDGFLSRHGYGHHRDNGSSANLRPSSINVITSGSSSNHHHHHHHPNHHHGVYCNYKNGRGLRQRPSKSEQSTPMQDPAARAALIQAVRQDFEDREAAKDAKIERRNQRALEREIRRRERLEQHTAKLHKMRLRSTVKEDDNGAGGNGGGVAPPTTTMMTPRTPPLRPESDDYQRYQYQQHQRNHHHHHPRSLVSYESNNTSRGGSAGAVSNHYGGAGGNYNINNTTAPNAFPDTTSRTPSPAGGADGNMSPRTPPARRFGFRRSSSSSAQQQQQQQQQRGDSYFAFADQEKTKPSHWYSRYKWGRKDRSVKAPDYSTSSSAAAAAAPAMYPNGRNDLDHGHFHDNNDIISSLGVDEYLPEKRIYTSPKDAWLWFITWLRTRLFKLARRLKQHKAKAH